MVKNYKKSTTIKNPEEEVDAYALARLKLMSRDPSVFPWPLIVDLV
jgi:hypothetical protein